MKHSLQEIAKHLLWDLTTELTVINNQIRNDYIHALSYGQRNQDDLNQLFDLVCDATISSLVETLRLLVTASSSREKGRVFYQEITDFIDNFLINISFR